MGQSSDSDVMGTRAGGVLQRQVQSPPHWLTVKVALNLKVGSPSGGRNLDKNHKTSFLRPSIVGPWICLIVCCVIGKGMMEAFLGPVPQSFLFACVVRAAPCFVKRPPAAQKGVPKPKVMSPGGRLKLTKRIACYRFAHS